MSLYHSRIIEILGVEEKEAQFYLRIMVVDEKKEFYWKLDSYTAKQLLAQLDFHPHYKYRLSFVSYWDKANQQQVSCIHKTNKEGSQKIYFPSSDVFKNQAAEIKHQNDLSQLSYLSDNQVSNNHRESLEPKEEINKKGSSQIKWVSIIFASLALAILVGFSSIMYYQSSANQTDERANAEEIVEPNASIDKAEKPDEVELVSNNTEEKEMKSPINKKAEHSYPYYELSSVKNFSLPKGKVAITFDDGPSAYTNEIVDILKNYNIGGTFFFIGVNMNKYQDNVKYVHTNGFSIGNHTFNHIELSSLSYEKQKQEYHASKQLLEEITGKEITLFRPPYGAFNDQTMQLMREEGTKAVLWNSDPRDWQNKSSSQILNYIKSTDPSGTIILLHETENTIKALPSIIEYLQEQGLEIVSLK